ncbi:MAG: hypothetical protein ACPGLY_15500 [Rubripirellula sp.]
MPNTKTKLDEWITGEAKKATTDSAAQRFIGSSASATLPPDYSIGRVVASVTLSCRVARGISRDLATV